MNPFPALFAFAQAIGFKAQDLTDRRLQERGVSPFGAFSLQRYALIPAILWCLMFVRPADIAYVFHTPVLLMYFCAIALIWNMQSFLSSYVMNATSSMSSLSTLENLLYLPLLLLVGTFFNHDVPNAYALAAIAALLCAFIIHPSQHRENERKRFSMPLAALAGLVLVKAILGAVNTGFTRAGLALVHPAVFLGVFATTTLLLCVVWTSFIPKREADYGIIRKRQWYALLIPALWFAASIPETFAYAALPIYTVVSIGAVTFGADIASDLSHRRIRITLRTASFILLVLLGTALAAYST